MDTLSHALIGAAVCSKTGLGGGTTGPRDSQGRPRFFHWTLWASFLFGFLPDFLSIGWYLTWQYPTHGHQTWRLLPDYLFLLYNWTHSLVIIALVLTAFYFWCRPLLLPALAWPLHVLMDVFSHGKGRFSTPLFWPVSELKFYGINWWQYDFLWVASWILVALLWGGVIVYRIRQKMQFRKQQQLANT